MKFVYFSFLCEMDKQNKTIETILSLQPLYEYASMHENDILKLSNTFFEEIDLNQISSLINELKETVGIAKENSLFHPIYS